MTELLMGTLAAILLPVLILIVLQVFWASISTVRHQHRQTFYLKSLSRAIERLEKEGLTLKQTGSPPEA